METAVILLGLLISHFRYVSHVRTVYIFDSLFDLLATTRSTVSHPLFLSLISLFSTRDAECISFDRVGVSFFFAGW